MKNYNILIVGSGRISEKMFDYASSLACSVICIPLRGLNDGLYKLEFNQFNLIIYAGYDHFSVYRNIRYLNKIIKKINNDFWKGVFVFLNSQSAIENEISSLTLRSYGKWVPNRYVITKKWQSQMLKNSDLNYVEYFIPIVTGGGSKQDAQLAELGTCVDVKLPNEGRNFFYFIDFQKLMKEIFSDTGRPDSFRARSVFIYSDYKKLADKLREDYAGSEFYLSTDAKNSHNLVGFYLIKYLVKSALKAYLSLFVYTFVTKKLSRQQPVTGAQKTGLKISTSAHEFYSRTFFPPQDIKNIRIIKL
jgi:hypothetical protein